MAVSPELRVSKALAVALPKFQVETAKIFDESNPVGIVSHYKMSVYVYPSQLEIKSNKIIRAI